MWPGLQHITENRRVVRRGTHGSEEDRPTESRRSGQTSPAVHKEDHPSLLEPLTVCIQTEEFPLMMLSMLPSMLPSTQPSLTWIQNVQMLFIDTSSAFNTVIPHRKSTSPTDTSSLQLGAELPDRQTPVRMSWKPDIGHQNRNTGTPQGCVLSPPLYTLFTYDCVASQNNTGIIKFGVDTTGIGLIKREVLSHNTQLVLCGSKAKPDKNV